MIPMSAQAAKARRQMSRNTPSAGRRSESVVRVFFKRNWFAGLFLIALAASAQDRSVTPISVQRRLALVIGNAAYPIGELTNPVNDARDVSAALRRLGFNVTTVTDVDRRALDTAVSEFAKRVRANDLAFFYYSGHGLQVQNENYLLPRDFKAESEADVPYGATPASWVRAKLEETGARVRVMILDACRNNPWRFKRSVPGGLAAMSNGAEGTLIAFAASDNQTADDNRAGSNGLYTAHLLQALETPGLGLRDVFDRAQAGVYAASAKRQLPAVYNMVVGRLVLKEGGPPVETQTRVDPAVEAWNGIKDSKDPAVFEKFAGMFPGHELAKVALLRVDALRPVVRVEPAPTPVPQRQSGKREGAVWIEPGSFLMGCSPGDNECFSNEAKPPKRVTIAKGFWMKETEVTQAEYERAMGANPSHFKGPNRPVEQVDWNQAKSYCEKERGRLPTAAEWEYAARAGTTAARYGDLGRVAWGPHNAKDETHDVRGLEPNAWGLYDMLGNVWEWTADNYDGTGKEVRGGSWDYVTWSLRASGRLRWAPSGRGNFIGFRCAWEQNSI